ncbi:MAG: T9SS type A sorting domain-containing protein [Bacteroidetes bacterium]|nr:T9SS type A sorting domain-containing protein [Bacteroidota bacterium]
MNFKFLFYFLIVNAFSYAQVLPLNRSVDWSLAGFKGVIPDYPTVLDISNYGGLGDGVGSNDTSFMNAVNSLSGANGVIYFPSGTFIFNSPINLRSGLILRGASSDSTILKFDLGIGNSSDAINIKGNASNLTAQLTSNVNKDSSFINVDDASGFTAGDYLKLSFNDSSILFSTWAYGTVGQIVKIKSIASNKIFFENPLRLSYDIVKNPVITKLNMITGVGIECLKIHRADQTTGQTSNINFNYAAQCWISGIESFQCNFSHLEINRTTNVSVTGSYFHDAFAFGGGGQGYGIICQTTSGECLIENNIFQHLRHSMLLQSGANGNVFGYNYSIDPFWTEQSLPANSAGDMVLHGNYPYANLFEGNIGQNIVIDDSHGKNGPYNTFLRNRAELYGIFMNNNPASDNQNFIGNEVTNTGISLGFYFINGIGHFQYGNNVKGTIYASGTNVLNDSSYYYSAIPFFLQSLPNWPSVGIPNLINSGTVPAKERFSDAYYTTCSSSVTTSLNKDDDASGHLSIFPNPSQELLYIKTTENISDQIDLSIYNSIGSISGHYFITSSSQPIDLSSYSKGIYIIKALTKKINYLPVKLIVQ